MNLSSNLTMQRRKAAQRYAAGRSNLLLMVALTLVNLVLLALGSDTMMLFSATVPYLLVAVGIISEYQILLIICCILASIPVLLYLICWLLSKKHRGWLTFALVLFALDTAILAAVYILAREFSGILDLVIHVAVLYYLFLGVRSGRWLKKHPETEEEAACTEEPPAESTPLRRADPEVKHRVLLETEHNGNRICYRRVKRINELVVNGYVYDEVSMLMETAHRLKAVVNGCVYEVGYDGGGWSFCLANGEVIERKVRVI